MSAALINRSLTNVRTELEFLYDSEVIDKLLFDTLMDSLPRKYTKNTPPWGLDKVRGLSGTTPHTAASPAVFSNSNLADSVADSLKKTFLHDEPAPSPHTPAPVALPDRPPAPVALPERTPAPAFGYCQASYNYDSTESGDLKLAKGDILAVTEHLSPDWWKGYKKGSSPALAGVFPSNYVSPVAEDVLYSTEPQSHGEKAPYSPEKTGMTSAPPMYQPAPKTGYQQGYQAQPSYGGNIQQPSYGGLVQQPSYGGQAQLPVQSTSYNGQQQMQPQQAPQQAPQQSSGGNDGSQHVRKFGSKLGNAAIFGAGATIGSEIVHLIF